MSATKSENTRHQKPKINDDEDDDDDDKNNNSGVFGCPFSNEP